jgi:23S rRNA (cytidine1920-2'-O)/16S rRNA (cytidine1409-2'-O)-methyltransferase
LDASAASGHVLWFRERAGARLVALIKPQFEVGKGRVARDPALHDEVCARLSRWLAEVMGWRVLGLTGSPIHSADGNREFLIAAERG